MRLVNSVISGKNMYLQSKILELLRPDCQAEYRPEMKMLSKLSLHAKHWVSIIAEAPTQCKSPGHDRCQNAFVMDITFVILRPQAFQKVLKKRE